MSGGYKVRGNIIYVYGSINGKHYRLSTGKEATKLNLAWIQHNYKDVLLQLVDKQLNPKITTNFVEYGLESLKANEYSRKESTILAYKYSFQKHIAPYFMHYDLKDIKPSDIKKWQSKLLENLEPGSIGCVRTILSTILADAVMDGLMVANPISSVKLPKPLLKDPMVPFTPEEVKKLIHSATGWFKIYLQVAFFTGMRPGEILALKWEDIDFEAKSIWIGRAIHKGTIGTPKTGRRRIIDMLLVVEQALKEQYKETGLMHGYVFSHSTGKKPYASPRSIVKNQWRPLLRRCGFAVRHLYDARHTFATMMLLAGEDILWVSQMLGHSTIATTMRYYIKYIPSNSKSRAEEVQKFCTDFAQKQNKRAV